MTATTDSGELTKGDINHRYFIDYSRKVGVGTGTVVRKCVDRQSKHNQRYAVKTVSKYQIKQIKNLRNEIEVLRGLDHPSIPSVVDVYEDTNYLHVVTELCRGGEVLKHIVKKNKKASPLEEEEAARILHQLIKVLSYCHGKDIVHRDLKLENILYTTKKRNTIKLIDFDIATRHREGDEALSQKAGTSYYLSPEVLSENYDRRCDIWALGVIAYVLLFGTFPFYGESLDSMFTKIRTQDVSFPPKSKVSSGARSFIESALQRDPTRRASLRELEQHVWMQETLWNSNAVAFSSQKNGKSNIAALKSRFSKCLFKARSTLL